MKRIQLSDQFQIQGERCMWRDHEDGWQVVVWVKRGECHIMAGPVSDLSLPLGRWWRYDEPCRHSMTGRTFKCIAEFSEMMIGWTGDEDRIRQAVEHMLCVAYGKDHRAWGNPIASNVGEVVCRWQWNDDRRDVKTRNLGEYVIR